MTELERLKAELERQDRDLAVCFERMRGLDADVVISVAPSRLPEGLAEAPPNFMSASWALRA